MKRYDSVIATTHIDSQGDRLTREALDSLVSWIDRFYIPIGVEHDPRNPPLGRIASAYVRERPDGEFEVAAIMELFEDSDPLPFEDARELILKKAKGKGLTLSYDWTHRSEIDQKDISDISKLLGNAAVYDMKKSVDPIGIITIGGAFVLGGIATGFLSQIGVDGWAYIKEKLSSIFARKTQRKGEQLFVLTALLELDGAEVDVEVIITDPTPNDIEILMSTGLHTLDKVLPKYLSNTKDIRRLVFEVEDGNLHLKFAVRKDCRPMSPSSQLLDILDN